MLNSVKRFYLILEVFTELIYQSLADQLMYAWKKRMKGEDKIIDSSYYSSIDLHLLENPEALSSPAYFRFLYLYVKDVYERKVQWGELKSTETEKLDPGKEKINIANKLLRKPYRDIVGYYILNQDMTY